MSKRKIVSSILGTSCVALLLFSCSQKVSSKPNFIFKAAPSQGAAAKVSGTTIKESEAFKDIQSEIYEAELKVYELKMNKLKALVLEKLMDKDPKKKGMTNDAYLEKFIVSKIEISEEKISAFIKERKIPAQHINDQMKTRIRQFLSVDLKKKAIDAWMAKQTAKSAVEIYIKKPARPVFDVNVGDAPFVGGADAKVTVVEFSDFQCPYCAKGATVLTALKKKYGNKVKIAFKNFPLPFHNHAQKAAEAGLCANEQGIKKFWSLHDKMFADQTKLDKDGLVNSAKELGLDTAKFTKCLDSGKFAEKIKADMKDGQDAGVKSTPTFFVNGKMVNGAQPVEIFSELIDAELAK